MGRRSGRSAVLATVGTLPRRSKDTVSRTMGGRPVVALSVVSAVIVVLVAAAVLSQALARGDGNVEVPGPNLEAIRVAELEAAARTADQSIATLRSELQAARDQGSLAADSQRQLEERLAQSERDIAALRDELTGATGQLQQQQQLVATQRQQMAALKECLAGHSVAIELGRQDSWNAANRAIATVADACLQARQVP
jgi:septal ring factor EnvC (AmiA/AmiB activator)